MLRVPPLRHAAHSIIKRMIPATLEVDGIRLVMNRQDPVICGALTLGCYERFELDVFRSALAEGMNVLDIGANIGLFTVVASKYTGQTGKVIAVEPLPVNCEFLTETIRQNGLTNIEIEQVAVSNNSGDRELFLSPENKGDNRLFPGGKNWRSVSVPMTTVDDIVKRHNMDRVDLIKMDIQGSEGLAIQGMTETLRRNPHVMILMEFWASGLESLGTAPDKVLATICELGFTIYHIDCDNNTLRKLDDPLELLVGNTERTYKNLALLGPGYDGKMTAGALSKREVSRN